MFESTGVKMFWAALMAFFGLACIAAIGYTRNAQLIHALTLGAFVFLSFAALLVLIIIWTEYVRGYEIMIAAQADWMNAFGKLDDEGRAAVAFQFPTIRYKMKRGLVREKFEDTQVSMDTFRLFLQTSNDKYISPQRDWQTKERPEWAWLEIYQWLADNDYIVPNSAAGNVSHLWVGNAYKHLAAYWLAGRKIVDMNTEAVYQEQT